MSTLLLLIPIGSFSDGTARLLTRRLRMAHHAAVCLFTLRSSCAGTARFRFAMVTATKNSSRLSVFLVAVRRPTSLPRILLNYHTRVWLTRIQSPSLHVFSQTAHHRLAGQSDGSVDRSGY